MEVDDVIYNVATLFDLAIQDLFLSLSMDPSRLCDLQACVPAEETRQIAVANRSVDAPHQEECCYILIIDNASPKTREENTFESRMETPRQD